MQFNKVWHEDSRSGEKARDNLLVQKLGFLAFQNFAMVYSGQCWKRDIQLKVWSFKVIFKQRVLEINNLPDLVCALQLILPVVKIRNIVRKARFVRNRQFYQVRQTGTLTVVTFLLKSTKMKVI